MLAGSHVPQAIVILSDEAAWAKDLKKWIIDLLLLTKTTTGNKLVLRLHGRMRALQCRSFCACWHIYVVKWNAKNYWDYLCDYIFTFLDLQLRYFASCKVTLAFKTSFTIQNLFSLLYWNMSFQLPANWTRRGICEVPMPFLKNWKGLIFNLPKMYLAQE